ncbi:hypothetical protein NDU88_000586 [Pleurodeles waltl]|uniref:Extracellular calcium-sensing receptor-like n=1 Tax=Pleurodeles waltl TaxID=8319 RepID=A0AAV7KN65_PLEWA|nr:hypothetical protein NDU88_000586 [Pleurodeles waltl]
MNQSSVGGKASKPGSRRGAALRPLFCCLMPVVFAQNMVPWCQLTRDHLRGFSKDGDITIGGIMWVYSSALQREATFNQEPVPATCQTFALQNYQWVRAMLFAIEEINNNPTILPNITLGFQIYDSCRMFQRSLKGTLQILSGQELPTPNYRCKRALPPAAIIGDSGSTRSIVLALILGLYRYPQISYAATSPLLGDRNQFPSFFRTVPSDDFQSRGLAQLVIHFGWTWVGILASDDDYGQQCSQVVQQELIKTGACLAFNENILLRRADMNAFHIAQVIKSSTATAIVVISSVAYLPPLLDEMVKQNVTGKIWIASEGWSTSFIVPFEKYSEILASTIGFAFHSGEMAGFQEYYTSTHPSTSSEDNFVRTFWEGAFGCQWLGSENLLTRDNKTKKCTGAENLDNLPINSIMDFRITSNIYNAVYAAALALEDLRNCLGGGGSSHQETCANISGFHPWQLLHYIKKVRLRREDTETFFDGYGNPTARYDIVNWQRDPESIIRFVKVGSYDSSAPAGKTLIINASAIQWAAGITEIPTSVCSPSCLNGFRRVIIRGKPTCCFQCVPCLSGEISNPTDSNECISCPWDQWPNDKLNICIPKATEFLAYEEPFGAVLATSSISLSVIPIVILGLRQFTASSEVTCTIFKWEACYVLKPQDS